MTDCELLDALKKQFDFALDYELCEFLEMSQTQISQVRSKTNPRPLQTKQRVMIYDHLGYAWARGAIIDLFPEQVGHKLRAMDILKTKRLASKKTTKHLSGPLTSSS